MVRTKLSRGADHRAWRWSAVAAAPLVLLATCGDQKAANKTNFKTALSKFFGQSCAVLPLTDPLTAMMGGLGGTKPPSDISAATLTGDQIDALDKAGIVTTKRVMKDGTDALGVPLAPTPTVVPFLTDKGKKLWHVAASGGGPSPSGLCDGHIEIVSVDNFTEPATLEGVKVSNVTFTMRKHIDDWAATPAMKSAFADSLGGPDTSQMTLPMQVNNDGWGVDLNSPDDSSN